jgi:hypothetical protein
LWVRKFEIEAPPIAQMGRSFRVRYAVENLTLEAIELVAEVETNEQVMFAGYKSTQFLLLPLSSRIMDHVYFPLCSGVVTLSALKVRKAGEDALLNERQFNVYVQ